MAMKNARLRDKTFAGWRRQYPWIERVLGDGVSRVRCRWCKVILQAKHTQITRHNKSQTHRKLCPAENGSQSSIDRIDRSQVVHESLDKMSNECLMSASTCTVDHMTEGDESQVHNLTDCSPQQRDHVVTVLDMDNQQEQIQNLKVMNLYQSDLDLLTGQVLVGEDQQMPDAASDVEYTQTSLASSQSVYQQAVNLMGEMYKLLIVANTTCDVTWHCREGTVKAHKLILAASSPVLKNVFEEDADDQDIYSPEVSSELIRSLICLFYTGRVRLKTRKMLTELKDLLQILEYTGELTEEEIKDEIPEVSCKETFDLADMKMIEIKFETDQLQLDANSDQQTEQTWRSKLSCFDSLDAEEFSERDQDDEIAKEECEDVTKSKKHIRGRKKPYGYRDTKVTYHFRGNNRRANFKGVKSLQLMQDLFETPRQDILAVSACPVCYRYFDTRNKLKLHMQEKHNSLKVKKGQHHVGKNMYLCPTCSKTISVQHLVWFIKHLRFCGKDEEKAADYLAPGVTDKQIRTEKNNVDLEDCLSTKNTKLKNIQDLAQVLIGKSATSLWGCRTCYEAYENRSELVEHRKNEHQGVARHGVCYDPSSRRFTCPHCNLVIRSSHLVRFIKHIKLCRVDPAIGLSKDDEDEGVEDDTAQDPADPMGVVIKPLRVVNLRSRWVCEALVGRLVPVLYPCHVCYTVFTQEVDIRHHFSTCHPNTENVRENGKYFQQHNNGFCCPVCKKSVCKKQQSSVFFTHHLARCEGKDHPVTKACPKCGNKFSKYRSYTYHVKTVCETTDFICHICTSEFRSNKDLSNHVQYAHTDARPFTCSICTKSYKRKGDLVHHQQSHNSQLEFSCEQCGKAFNQRKKLQRHMLSHISFSDRPLKCPHCDLRFVLKQKLDNHIATHFDTKRFFCHMCGAGAKTKDGLYSHRRKVHKMKGTLPHSVEVVTLEQLQVNIDQTQVVPNANLNHHDGIAPVNLTQAIVAPAVQAVNLAQIDLEPAAADGVAPVNLTPISLEQAVMTTPVNLEEAVLTPVNLTQTIVMPENKNDSKDHS